MGDYFNRSALGSTINLSSPTGFNSNQNINKINLLNNQAASNTFNLPSFSANAKNQQAITNNRIKKIGNLSKNNEKKKNAANVANAALGAGLSLGSSIVKGLPDNYNTSTGLQEPNAAKDIIGGTLEGASIGNSIVPGWGALIGAVLGAGASGFQQYEKDQDYAEATRKIEGDQERNAKNKYLGVDFTSTQIGGPGGTYSSAYGMPINVKYGGQIGKYGLKSNQSLAELEPNEIVVRKNPKTGKNFIVLETDNSIPKHEQGGKVFALNEGDYVFPKQFINPVKQAIKNNDDEAFNNLKQQMLLTSTAAALQGKEFSNTAGIDEQLKEMDESTLKKLDKKMGNMDMNMNFSRYGSHVGKNKMEYGGMNYSKMKQGGMLKQIPAGKKGKGLRELKEESPETVNKMGYMQAGGMPNNPYMPVMAGQNYMDNQMPMNYNQQLYGDIMNPQMMQMGGMVEDNQADIEVGEDNENEMDFNFNELVQQMKYGAKMMNGGMAKMMKYGAKMGYGGKNKKQFAYGGMNTMKEGGINTMMEDPGDPTVRVIYGLNSKKNERLKMQHDKYLAKNPQYKDIYDKLYPRELTGDMYTSNQLDPEVYYDPSRYTEISNENKIKETTGRINNAIIGLGEYATFPINATEVRVSDLPNMRSLKRQLINRYNKQ